MESQASAYLRTALPVAHAAREAARKLGPGELAASRSALRPLAALPLAAAAEHARALIAILDALEGMRDDAAPGG